MNRRYTIKLDSIWSPVVEVPRRAARALRSGRGLRALHARTQGDRRSARRGRSDDQPSPHRRSAAIAPGARRELSRHALPRGHPQRYGGRRRWWSVRRIRWRWSAAAAVVGRLRTRTGGLTDAERYRHTHRHINAQIDHRAARCRAARSSYRLHRPRRLNSRRPNSRRPSSRQPSNRPSVPPRGRSARRSRRRIRWARSAPCVSSRAAECS